MNGYTKIFQSIVTSTIWQESNDCRVLWITMLALKESDQICRATVPALAKLAGISIEDTEKFLQKFQEPDKYSRSQEHEGRRIRPAEGGWFILNGWHYQDLLRSAERRDYIRNKVNEYRNKNKAVNSGKQSKQCKPLYLQTKTKTKTVGEGGLGETLSIPESRKARATGFPEAFSISDSMLAWALSDGFVEASLAAEFEKFRDHHVARGTRFIDWPAAWRTWMRRSREFSQSPPPAEKPPMFDLTK